MRMSLARLQFDDKLLHTLILIQIPHPSKVSAVCTPCNLALLAFQNHAVLRHPSNRCCNRKRPGNFMPRMSNTHIHPFACCCNVVIFMSVHHTIPFDSTQRCWRKCFGGGKRLKGAVFSVHQKCFGKHLGLVAQTCSLGSGKISNKRFQMLPVGECILHLGAEGSY